MAKLESRAWPEAKFMYEIESPNRGLSTCAGDAHVLRWSRRNPEFLYLTITVYGKDREIAISKKCTITRKHRLSGATKVIHRWNGIE